MVSINSMDSTFPILYIASLDSLLKNGFFFFQIVTDGLHLRTNLQFLQTLRDVPHLDLVSEDRFLRFTVDT